MHLKHQPPPSDKHEQKSTIGHPGIDGMDIRSAPETVSMTYPETEFEGLNTPQQMDQLFPNDYIDPAFPIPSNTPSQGYLSADSFELLQLPSQEQSYQLYGGHLALPIRLKPRVAAINHPPFVTATHDDTTMQDRDMTTLENSTGMSPQSPNPWHDSPSSASVSVDVLGTFPTADEIQEAEFLATKEYPYHPPFDGS